MLRDTPIRTVPNDLPRKWLIDDHLELILWYLPTGEIAGFELVYDRLRHPRSIRWFPNGGFQHHQIDTGEDNPGKNRTPMLLAGDRADIAGVLDEFERRSTELPETIRGYVLDKLRGHIGPE